MIDIKSYIKLLFNYILMFLMINYCFSQNSNYTFTFVDSTTNEPIEDVQVFVSKIKQSFFSNQEGVIKFTNSPGFMLEINHSQYKKINHRVLKSDSEINFTITLTPVIQQLDEVILTSKHPQLILESIIKNSKDKFQIPATLRIYTREFFKKNNQYTYFTDGLMNIQLFEDKKQLNADILIEQSRTLGLVAPLEEDLLGYHLNDLIINYYNFGYIEELLQKRALRIYDFYVKQHPTIDTYYTIVAKPKDNIKGHMYENHITYDDKLKLIKEIRVFLPEDRKTFPKRISDTKTRLFLYSDITKTYELKSNHYYLIKSIEIIGYIIKEKGKEVPIEIKNQMVTNKFTPKLFEYVDNNVFKDKTLILSQNKVYNNYWDYDSGMSMTLQENEIIEELNNNPHRFFNEFVPQN